MVKFNLIASACLCALSLGGTHAQTGPSAADVFRNIEQNKIDLHRIAPKPQQKQSDASITTDQGFARLKEVQVKSPLFQEELMAYWTTEINTSVPTQKLNDFKAYAWQLFQRKGYLAYITTSAQTTHEGSALSIHVTLPTVGKLSVITAEDDKSKALAKEVAHRFRAIYKKGTPVDVQGFENQLSAAAYDLPVDLEISMRQVNDSVVDVVIHLSRIEAQLGKVLGGVIQANNYGLQQFGRNQLLGSVRIGGFTPSSELTLTTQLSDGVGYYRTDYEAPITGTGMRWKVYASEVKSNSATTRGLSHETGASLTKLLSADRVGRWLTGAEVSRRETQNWPSGVITADRVDQQLRLKLRADSSKGWVDNFSNEFVLTTGNINLDRFSDDKTDDASNLKVAGSYQKLEMNGGLSHVLDKDGIYTGAIRWRAQAAAKNLDTYNKIALGGVNGVRAYSSIDGVGDQGAQLSFDIIHQVVPDVWGGLFYDIGSVKNDHKPLTSAASSDAYVLQGAGMQVGGKIEQFNWTLSMAIAFGKKPDSWTSANTQPGDSRVNLAVTRPF